MGLVWAAEVAVRYTPALSWAAGYVPNSAGVPKSTVQREKLEGVGGFNNDCIVDELGWISNESQVKNAMKYFWSKTGVQPWAAGYVPAPAWVEAVAGFPVLVAAHRPVPALAA